VHSRAGFTFIEMLIVMVIAGLVYAISIKPVRGAFMSASRRAASREVTMYLFRARTIAMQQSRLSWLVRSGNVLKVVVDSEGTKVQVGTMIDMNARYGATLAVLPVGKDSIKFDPRGFVLLAGVGGTPKVVVTISPQADTLCVTGLGRITVKGTASLIMTTMAGSQTRNIAASVAESRFERLRGQACTAHVNGTAVTRGVRENWTVYTLARADDVVVTITMVSNHRTRTQAFRSYIPC
jgi:prepilin-type N-terminal cleavage/methylation domain-containing protein